jgi:hypothetical protein
MRIDNDKKVWPIDIALLIAIFIVYQVISTPSSYFSHYLIALLLIVYSIATKNELVLVILFLLIISSNNIYPISIEPVISPKILIMLAYLTYSLLYYTRDNSRKYDQYKNTAYIYILLMVIIRLWIMSNTKDIHGLSMMKEVVKHSLMLFSNYFIIRSIEKNINILIYIRIVPYIYLVYGIAAIFAYSFAEFGINSTIRESTNINTGLNYSRVSGIYGGHPTQFAGFMAVGYGFVLSIYEKNKQYRDLVIMGICVIAILLANSRAGILSIVIITLIYTTKNRINFFSTILVLIAIGAAFSMFGGEFVNRSSNIVNYSSYLSSRDPYESGSRIAIWIYYLELLLTHPSSILTGWRLSQVSFISSHSLFLEILFQCGLFVFIAYIINLRSIIKLTKGKYGFYDFRYPLFGYIIPGLLNENWDITMFPLIFVVFAIINSTEKLNDHNESTINYV